MLNGDINLAHHAQLESMRMESVANVTDQHPTPNKGKKKPRNKNQPRNMLIPSYPQHRYILITTIVDETTYITLVIFGREGEKIIGRPIEALLTLYEKGGGKEKVFNILQQCVGREYTMKVKIGITKYNAERELKCQKILTTSNDPPTPTIVERNDKNQRSNQKKTT